MLPLSQQLEEMRQQVRRRSRQIRSRAAHKTSRPTLEQALEGTHRGCHQVISALSHYCLCCLIAFIPLHRGEKQHKENNSSYNFREVQFQTTPRNWIIKQGFPAQCTAFAVPSGYLPESTLSRQQADEHPEKAGSWDPAKQLIELVTQNKKKKGSKRGCQRQKFQQTA